MTAIIMTTMQSAVTATIIATVRVMITAAMTAIIITTMWSAVTATIIATVRVMMTAAMTESKNSLMTIYLQV